MLDPRVLQRDSHPTATMVPRETAVRERREDDSGVRLSPEVRAPECLPPRLRLHRRTSGHPTRLQTRASSELARPVTTVYSSLIGITIVLIMMLSWPSPSEAVTSCRSSLETPYQRAYVCRQHPEYFPLLKYAEMVAKEECQRAFKKEEWNCSSFSILKTPPIAKDANKETAYIHALSVAAIAHSFVEACMSARIPSSSCESCGGSFLDCGLKVAQEFLEKRVHGRGIQQDVNSHNYQSGKLLIQSIIDGSQPAPSCTCHGASGSCTMTTCTAPTEFVLPELSVIGKRLKELHDQACFVSSNSATGEHFRLISQCGREYTEEDLIFISGSPDYCTASSEYGTNGVAGRECDLHSSGRDSCQNLCVNCGRGFSEHVETVELKCECSFHYCCEVHCNTCAEKRTFYTCT